MGSGFSYWETSEGLHTLTVARGRFVRLCVEIDLNQPVVGRVGVEGTWYNVEYEGLHLICARCGCYGHLLKDCPIKQHVEKVVEQTSDEKAQQLQEREKSDSAINMEPKNQDVPHNDQVNEILHREWLNVVRKKCTNKPGIGAKNKEPASQGSGNRFHALLQEKLEEEILKNSFKGGPSKSDTHASQPKASYKKRQRREIGLQSSNGPVQGKTKSGVLRESTHKGLSNTSGNNSEQRLKQVVFFR